VTEVDPLGFGEFSVIPPTCFNSDGQVTLVITGGTGPYYYSASTGVVAVSFSSSQTFYNIGGGPKNTLSLLELINFLETKLNNHLNFNYSDWRPGDQMIYVSDISKIKNHIGWEPKVSINDGLNRLLSWVSNNEYVKNIFK
jgi:nucleoside-diphosphate-sugar epimerase